MKKVALITGASSGFGAAIAKQLAKRNICLGLGARRVDRLESLKKEIQSEAKVFCHPLDVQKTESVTSFFDACIDQFGHVDYLINNAGFARGLNTIEQSSEADWQEIWETNVMGSVRMIQEVLPHMKSHSGCRIINIGSVAGIEAYEGGGAYCASKFALLAVTKTLRYELLEKGIGVSTVDPGMAETEFSIVRFDGDKSRAKKVYEGFDPLTSQDIAEIVDFVISRPNNVNIDQLLVYPTAQTSGRRTNRRL